MPIDSSGPIDSPAPRSSVDSCAEPPERRPRRLRVAHQAPDRHQAPDLERLERGDPGDRGFEHGRVEAGLGRVGIDVDLEQDRVADPGPNLVREPAKPLGQAHGVDGLDRIEQLQRVSRLVGLERPDQVPARAGDERDLDGRLLDPVLAEQVEPGRDRVAQRLGIDGLGDRDQGDRAGIATGAPAGGARSARATAILAAPVRVDPAGGSTARSCVGRPAPGRP